MSTPERPDRGDAPHERLRGQHYTWCLDAPVNALCICERRSGSERRSGRDRDFLRRWSDKRKAERRGRREGPDRRRSPEDRAQADDMAVVLAKSREGTARGAAYWRERVDAMLAASEEPSPVGAAFVLGREYGNASMEDADHIVDELERMHDMSSSPDAHEALVEALRLLVHAFEVEVNTRTCDIESLRRLNLARAALRSPEDVRGADVGEARELAEWVVMFDESRNADGSLGDDSDAVYHDMVKCAREIAALRSPEPAAEPRYTLAEVAGMLEGHSVIAYDEPYPFREAARWLRSGGATTETGERDG